MDSSALLAIVLNSSKDLGCTRPVDSKMIGKKPSLFLVALSKYFLFFALKAVSAACPFLFARCLVIVVNVPCKLYCNGQVTETSSTNFFYLVALEKEEDS